MVPVLPVHPICHKYWSLSYRFIPYITSIGPFPTVTFHYITSTGPCPTGTSPLSQVLVPVLTAHPLNPTTDPCPTDTPPMSQVQVPFSALFHKYWLLSYRYIPYITILAPLLTAHPLNTKLLASVLPIHSTCHMYLPLSYRYILFITSIGPCPTSISPKPKNLTLSCRYIPYMSSTVTSTISQVLVPVLPEYHLYHKYWILPYRYISKINSTGPHLQLYPLYDNY